MSQTDDIYHDNISFFNTNSLFICVDFARCHYWQVVNWFRTHTSYNSFINHKLTITVFRYIWCEENSRLLTQAHIVYMYIEKKKIESKNKYTVYVCGVWVWNRAFRGSPKRKESLIDRIVRSTIVNHPTIKKKNI